MNKDNMTYIAKTGTAEDVINLLRSYGGRGWDYYGIDGRIEGYGHCLDTICSAVSYDTDEARKAAKKTLIAAYAAQGKKAFESHPAPKRPELETMRQLAFKGAAEKLVALLKAQANDPEAVSAIIKGAQQDRKRHLRREPTTDKDRRSDKRNVLTEFLAKSGPFAAAEEVAPDAQARIGQLESQLAEVQKAVAKQRPATALKLQQPALPEF